MKAVILAAGIGLRLHPLTKETNKVILPIRNTSTLENMLTLLCDEGIESVVVTGFDHEKVSKVVRKHSGSTIYNKDFKKDEYTIVDSLALAWKIFGEYENLLLMGDLFIDEKTLETIVHVEANSCLIDSEIRIEDTLVKGRDNKVEKFLVYSKNSRFVEESIVGSFLYIFHFKEGTCLSRFLKETFSQRFNRSQNVTVRNIFNKVVQFEGMKYEINSGYCQNLNTFDALKTISNYLQNER